MNSESFSLITTADGSPSLYCREYDESMHSSSGAYEEAVLKHVVPSGILNIQGTSSVLEIGCGMGFNILALMSELLKTGTVPSVDVISIEKEFGFVKLLEKVRFDDERDDLYKAVRKAISEGHAASHGFSIRIERGDARSIITRLPDKKFNAVFHDPFSPSKNPELWSVDFFKQLLQVMHPQGILTTYSSAVQVRRAMIEAGFSIGAGPPVGKKREGTLAGTQGPLPVLNGDRIRTILEDPRGIPYRDESLTCSRESILIRRRREMRAVKRGLQAR